MCRIFLPDRERALQEEKRLSQSERHSKSPVVGETHKARSDCCRPVPLITTSQRVSLKDSIFTWSEQTRMGSPSGAVVVCCWAGNDEVGGEITGSENLNEVEAQVGTRRGGDAARPAEIRPALAHGPQLPGQGTKTAGSARSGGNFFFLKSALNKPRDCCFTQRRRGG